MKLIKFEAEWCSACKAQDKLLEAAKESLPSITVYDVEEFPDEANEYNIRSLPTIIVLDDDNNEVNRFVGLTSINKIQEFIK